MQVINESLDDLKKLEDQLKATPKSELGVDDDLFLKASIAQSKAIAGLALAIKEGGGQDTFGLTLHAPVGSVEGNSNAKQSENDRPKACPEEYHVYQELYTDNKYCPACGERLSA